MLVVCYEVNGDDKYQEMHVSQSPRLKTGHLAVHPGLKYVSADGHELQEIRDQILGIPDHVRHPVVMWYGDHARFILGNLKL